MMIDKETAAEVLEKAADLFESSKLKWIQGSLGDLETTACAYGGVRVAAGCTAESNLNVERSVWGLIVWGLVEILADRLGMEPNCGPIVGTIAEWNDQKGRTVAEVIDLYKEAAKDLRNANPS